MRSCIVFRRDAHAPPMRVAPLWRLQETYNRELGKRQVQLEGADPEVSWNHKHQLYGKLFDNRRSSTTLRWGSGRESCTRRRRSCPCNPPAWTPSIMAGSLITAGDIQQGAGGAAGKAGRGAGGAAVGAPGCGGQTARHGPPGRGAAGASPRQGCDPQQLSADASSQCRSP